MWSNFSPLAPLSNSDFAEDAWQIADRSVVDKSANDGNWSGEVWYLQNDQNGFLSAMIKKEGFVKIHAFPKWCVDV